MEHGRRTSWTGRPRPQHVSAREFSQTLRVTTPIVLPASMSASHLPISSTTPSSYTLTESAVRDGLTRIRPGRTKGSPCTSPFLTGSWSQTEFPVTHSKQTTDEILTGARMHIRIFEILQISAQNLAALNPQSHARFANFRAVLTETEQHSEIVVTYSKQTTEEFLTETRIASRHDLNFAPRRSKFK
jgi:hypothetical protein